MSALSKTRKHGKTQKNLPRPITQAIAHSEDIMDTVSTPTAMHALPHTALVLATKHNFEASDRMTQQDCKSNNDISNKVQVVGYALTYANQAIPVHIKDDVTLTIMPKTGHISMAQDCQQSIH